jgi:hypothetical protein
VRRACFDPKQLAGEAKMAATATGTTATATSIKKKSSRTPKQLPAPNSDFHELYETLNADELAILRRVRAFMEAKVAPVITPSIGLRMPFPLNCCRW